MIKTPPFFTITLLFMMILTNYSQATPHLQSQPQKFYLIDNIKIKKYADKDFKVLIQKLEEEYLQLKDKIYFSTTQGKFLTHQPYYIDEREWKGEKTELYIPPLKIDVAVFYAQETIKLEVSCVVSKQCGLIITLAAVDESDTRLQKIITEHKALLAEKKQFYLDSKEKLQKIGFNFFSSEESRGYHHRSPIKVILPSYTQIHQVTGWFYERFDQIKVDDLMPNAKQYRIGSTSNVTLTYVEGVDKDLFSLKNWLDFNLYMPEAILYQDEYGAIFYGAQDNLGAIYYHYDEQKRAFLFAQVSRIKHLQQIASHYEMIRTINPQYYQQIYQANHQRDSKFYAQEKIKLQKMGLNDFIGKTLSSTINLTLPKASRLYETEQPFYHDYDRFDLKAETGEETITRLFLKSEEQTQLVKNIHFTHIENVSTDPFALQNWLDNYADMPEAVLYQEPSGAIFYDINLNLRAIYFYYDKEKQCITFAVAKADNLADIRDKYAIIRTIEPNYYANRNYSVELAKLTPPEFKQQFGDLYDIEATEQQLKSFIKQSFEAEYSSFHEQMVFKSQEKTKEPIADIYSELFIETGEHYQTYRQTQIDNMKKSGYKVIYQDENILFFESIEPSNKNQQHWSSFFIRDGVITYQIMTTVGSDTSNDSWVKHIKVFNTLRSLPKIQAAELLKVEED